MKKEPKKYKKIKTRRGDKIRTTKVEIKTKEDIK